MKAKMISKLRPFHKMSIFTMALVLVLLADSTNVSAAGQTKSPAVTPPSASGYVTELEALIDNAIDIYEHARSNKWRHIGTKLNAIKKAEQQSSTIAMNENSASLLPKLIETTSDLERSIASQHRSDAMIYANRITMIGTKMAAPLNPRVPVNIAIIGYSARKLEILSETQNVAKMADIVYKIHLSWQPLIPQIIEHGGAKEIKKFAEIMKRLDAAKTAEEYGRHAASALEEVEHLEQLFSK